MLIRYVAKKVSQAQIDWGNHVDPTGILETEKEYELDRVAVHSQHTKVFLKDFPGKSFNSVWFDVEDVNALSKDMDKNS